MQKLRNSTDRSFATSHVDIFDTSREYIRNNLNGSSVIIPHVCNNIGAFGAGFAADVAQKYPHVSINFTVGGPIKIGNTQFVVAEDSSNGLKNKIIFANMVCQNGILSHKNKRPLHYPSLVKCMITVRDYVNDLATNDNRIRIHAPKFGSGLAGGNWHFISDLIDDIWHHIPVCIFIKK